MDSKILVRAQLSAAALVFCLLLALPAIASAASETITFDNDPPEKPVEKSVDAQRIIFPAEPGYRPYPVNVTRARAQSGEFVGDIGRCREEAEATGKPLSSCPELSLAATTALLSQTASSVIVDAGTFGPEQGFAKMLAFNANGEPIASTGAVRLQRGSFHTELKVVAPLGEEIASFSIEALAENEVSPSGDLGIDDVSVNFTGSPNPDFAVFTTTEVIPVVQGQTAQVPVQVLRLNGSHGAIKLRAEGLPRGVSTFETEIPENKTIGAVQLIADPTAPDTNFNPTEATIVAEPVNDHVGPAPHRLPFNLRVAADFKLSYGDVGEVEEKSGEGGEAESDPTRLAIRAPDCAPVDVPIKITRDIAMRRDVNLSVSPEEEEEGHPASEGEPLQGISAEFLPDADVPPGGNLAAERTLRLRAGPESLISFDFINLLIEGSDDPHSPTRSLEVTMLRNANAHIATDVPGSGYGYTPRLGKPGSAVQIHGTGFCPGTEVMVGNKRAIVPAKLVNDHTIEFRVPRLATSGEVTIIPPGKRLFTYTTEDRLAVDSFRNTTGFPFPNFRFRRLGLDEFTKAFGDDDIFEKVNPCWPFGDCSFSTGILDPIAAIDWGLINGVMQLGGAHCFGMALSSQELNDGRVKYREVADATHGNAHSAFELGDVNVPPYSSLEDFLDAEQVKEFSGELASAFFDRPHTMRTQLARLEEEFSKGHEPMIALDKNLSRGESHAVIAYDLEQTPEFDTIYVYNPNDPFSEGELHAQVDPQAHAESVGRSTIVIDKATGKWVFDIGPGTKWEGSSNDGSLWVVPFNTVPKNPSLPGEVTLAKALRYISIGSTDGSIQAVTASQGAELLPTSENLTGGSGQWVTADTRHRFDGTVEGVESGHYTEAYTSPGFVAAATDVATAKGVRDTLGGKGDRISIQSGTSRPLALQLARRASSAATSAATLETGASAHGSDAAALAKSGALTYTHQGAPTTLRFALTAVRRNGGPATFISGPVAVGNGDRLRAKALDRDMSRVRLEVRGAHGQKTVRVLTNRAAAPGRLEIGAPKVSRRRLTVPLKLSRFHGRAVVGAVLRLSRGSHVVAHKAISLMAGNGSRRIAWKLPQGLKRGSYRLKTYVRTLTTGGPGSTIAGSLSAHRTVSVRVGQ